MTEPFPLLVVGLNDTELELLRQETMDQGLIRVPDGPLAVACLKSHNHKIPIVLLDAETLGDELEELVAYVKGAFPEAALAVLGALPEEDRRRLNLLGVSRFLDRPLARQSLSLLLSRTSDLGKRPTARSDWSVTVDKGDWVEITVPSQEEYVSRVQDLIDLLERSKLDQDTRDEMMLALDELVHNAMEWGNRYEADKKVRVSYYCAEDRVVLKVEDEGEGFNTSEMGDPTGDLKQHLAARAESGKRPGGFGIHMIRNLMDEFIYNDRGNVVMLTKYLEEPPA